MIFIFNVLLLSKNSRNWTVPLRHIFPAENEHTHTHTHTPKGILKGNDPGRAGIYIACSLTHTEALWDARNFLGLLNSEICSHTSASETELNCQSADVVILMLLIIVYVHHESRLLCFFRQVLVTHFFQACTWVFMCVCV